MSLILARCPGNELIVVMALPFVLGALALLSLATSIMLFKLSWSQRIPVLTKLMIGTYVISLVFGAAIVMTNDPSDNSDWVWLVAVLPLVPVFQGLVCRYLSKVSLGMQRLPEKKPLDGVIPWISLAIWLVPLLLLWWFFSFM